MGVFLNKLFGDPQKDDAVTKVLSSLNNDYHEKVMSDITSLSAESFQELLETIKNNELNKKWKETKEAVDKAYHYRVSPQYIIEDINSGQVKKIKNAERNMKGMSYEIKKMIKSAAKLKKERDSFQVQREKLINLISEISLPSEFKLQAVQVLIQTACDSSSDLSTQAEKSLKYFGNLAESSAAKAIKAGDNEQIKILLRILKAAEPNCKETFKVLVEILKYSPSSLTKDMLELIKTVPLRVMEMKSDEIPELAKLLSDELPNMPPEIRTEFVNIFCKMGVRASCVLPSLYKQLIDTETDLKVKTAVAIYAINSDEEMIPMLVDIFFDGDTWHSIKGFYRYSEYVLLPLASFGKPVIPFLKDRIKSNSSEARRYCIEILRRMRKDSSEVLPVFEGLLEDNDKSIRAQVIDAIGDFREEALYLAPKLLDIWKESGEDKLIDTLCKVKSPVVIDLLLRCAYDSPGYIPSELEKRLMEFAYGFPEKEQMLKWALKASGYNYVRNHIKGDSGYISLNASNDAIRNLIEVKSNFTSNILHFVANKKDVSVRMDNGCDVYWDYQLSFESQKTLALEELRLRGNPPYDYNLFVYDSDLVSPKIKQQIAEASKEEKEKQYRDLLDEAWEASREFAEYKWSKYEKLVKCCKTKEVFHLLVDDLIKYKAMSQDDINNFVRFLTQTAKELDEQTVINLLSPAEKVWPEIYYQVMEKLGLMKRGRRQ